MEYTEKKLKNCPKKVLQLKIFLMVLTKSYRHWYFIYL